MYSRLCWERWHLKRIILDTWLLCRLNIATNLSQCTSTSKQTLVDFLVCVLVSEEVVDDFPERVLWPEGVVEVGGAFDEDNMYLEGTTRPFGFFFWP